MFSVVIPYYKKIKYIERCIDSVLSQTIQNYEIIVVNDGSNDDVEKLLSGKYGAAVRLISQENQGVSMARNAGIAAAVNPYVAFLDADDSWSPIYLECVKEIIEENEDVKIIGSKYSRLKSEVQEQKNAIESRLISKYFKDQACKNTLFSSSSTVIKKSFFECNSGFNPLLKRGEDIDVWLRAVASGGSVFYIENTLVYYSDEDELQATKTLGKVEDSLIGQINFLYKPLMEKVSNADFDKFVSKCVYFNLYPYFFSEQNHRKAKESLNANEYYYFFLHLPYYLPFRVGKGIVRNLRLSRYLRLYFKFFLRKIYL